MKVTAQEENGNIVEVDINSTDVSVLIRQDTREPKAVRVFMYNPAYNWQQRRTIPMFVECEHQFVTLPTEEAAK